MTGTKDVLSGGSVVAGPWPGSAQDAGSPTRGSPANEAFWNISYSHPLRPFGGSIWVKLSSKGKESTLSLSANWHGRQEIGFYSGLLPADRSEMVRNLVERSNFARYASHGTIAPDTPYTSLGYNPKGEVSEAEIFVSLPPAPVAEAMNAIENLGEEVRKYPYLAIAGSAAWNQPRFRVGDALELTVTLRSVGEKPVTFDNPLGSASPEWTGLRMVVAVARSDDKLDPANEVARVDIARQDLLTTERRLPNGEPRIEVPPGKELQFIVRRKFHMSPGFYKAVITYHGSNDPDNVKVIGGALDMDLGRIEITP